MNYSINYIFDSLGYASSRMPGLTFVQFGSDKQFLVTFVYLREKGKTFNYIISRLTLFKETLIHS
jgi:hypothetical protein